MSQAFAAAVRGTGFELGDAAYGARPDQIAEVVLPPATGPLPLVIVIHGGFWRAIYDRTHTAPQCVALARAGWAVAALEYRRVGGGGGWPETFADVAAGVDAVPEALGSAIDPDRVVLMGHSAGGHLALWAAGRHRLPSGAPG
jgi:acetyl esterase/lipase